ncbi:OmpA family protein [Bacteroides sp. OttesenSCG-928-E20]|nr:OmpA family protein [Bacteroides sp. OttesenSCG-928-E20]MDL2305877.1 OmpA family protein [Bacteroides sp. OttesenSCG-928-D19]
MKSKLVILSLLLAGSVVTATAQKKEKYYSESCKDNIFLSVGVGGHVIANGDSFDELGFGSALAPMVSLSLGKFINPVWGVRLQGSVVFNAKLYSDLYPQSKATYPQMGSLKRTHGNIHADAMVNLTNLFAGYKPGRMFELMFFAGPSLSIANGYGHTLIETKDVVVEPGTTVELNGIEKVTFSDKELRAHIGASVGLGAKFNINEYWAIDVEARGYITPSVFVNQSNQKSSEGYVTGLVGATYTFGGKKFAPVGSKIDKEALNDEINKYRKALDEAEAELAACKNALANVKPVREEIIKEIEVAGARAIFFQIGKSNIDDYGMVNLQLAAKIMKANPNKKYKVAGYADKATGSASFNQKLSEKRAQNVYDALVKEGVNPSQMELVGFGGTANMFGQNKLNRVVILE